MNEGLFDLPRSEKRYIELYIFEKGVFWSGPGRKSRGLGAAKAEKWGRGGGLSRGTYPYCPYTGVPPPGGGVYIQYYTIF